MSTNFYVVTNEAEDLHFGKSSNGWVFSLRIHPAQGINTLYDWMTVLATPGNTVCDESGRAVSVQELLNTVMIRKGARRPADEMFSTGCTQGEGSWDYCNYEFC